MYLRNSFLQFQSFPESSNPLQSLKLIKSSLSYCDFYLKQLITSIENPTGTSDLESQVGNESKISKQNSQLDSTEAVPFIPLPPVEDEIFEEDLSKTKTENQRLDTTSDDFDLPDKIDPLANKNLFYELKFALKFKSNEWRQREKIAIKKKTTMKRVDQDENNTPEHLLDNEAMRYKSELRRRRRQIGKVGQVESNNMSKYDENPQENKRKSKYVYEDDDQDDSQQQPRAFFAELVNKAFLHQQNNQRNDDEETLVYE